MADDDLRQPDPRLNAKPQVFHGLLVYRMTGQQFGKFVQR